MQAAADVGVGQHAPLGGLRRKAAIASPDVRELVEKIVSALVAADVTEARHLLVIFGADIGKAVGSILDVPADYYPKVVAVISAFLKDLPHLADVEVRLRDDLSHGALGDYLAHVDCVTTKRTKTDEDMVEVFLGDPGGGGGVAGIKKKFPWASSGGLGSTQEDDEKQRKRWTDKAVALLKAAEAPSVLQAMNSSDPDLAMGSLMGRARPKTIQLGREVMGGTGALAGMALWLQMAAFGPGPRGLHPRDAPGGSCGKLSKDLLGGTDLV